MDSDYLAPFERRTTGIPPAARETITQYERLEDIRGRPSPLPRAATADEVRAYRTLAHGRDPRLAEEITREASAYQARRA